MKVDSTQVTSDDLRPEYSFDFSKAERGRYAQRLKMEGSIVIFQANNLGKPIPDSAANNAIV